MCSSGKKVELRLRVQTIQQGLQPVRRTIQIEGIVGADKEMNFAAQIGRQDAPMSLNPAADVVVFPPLLDNLRIDGPRGAIKHLERAAIRTPGREDPLE